MPTGTNSRYVGLGSYTDSNVIPTFRAASVASICALPMVIVPMLGHRPGADDGQFCFSSFSLNVLRCIQERTMATHGSILLMASVPLVLSRRLNSR